MWMVLLPALLLAQAPAERPLLEAEQSREAGVAALRAAIASSDAQAQRLAARALGRLENPAHADAMVPLFRSNNPQVRLAAASALAQMRAPFAYGQLLAAERDTQVRAAVLEAIGRAKPPAADAETMLVNALVSDPGGAARGLEASFRLNAARRPEPATLTALHTAFAKNRTEEVRELILLTMNGARDKDAATLESALADESPQVRRLAVIGSGKWVDDPSPIVRLQALRAAGSCERAARSVGDGSDHVALAAVDLLGSLRCDPSLLAPLVAKQRPWRVRAHALVALAAVDPAAARAALPAMAADPVWQVRAYAARAARLLKAEETLSALLQDKDPNVAIAAMTTAADAARALRSNHAGLVLAGAQRLKGEADLKAYLPALTEAFLRLTAEGSMTLRDPRVALLTRIGEAGDASANGMVRKALSDRDPAVAAVAGRILQVAPVTVRLPVPALPDAAYIRGLTGASARIRMRGLGAMTVNLLTEEAPVTVSVFAQLAEAGKYNGLTFHRVVSNFVIQGGSPGADEYDGRSRDFLRDELGLARHVRGTIGISTRGRDTGDAQIFFNLVDNFRLDRDYTVMAVMREGMDVMDRVQEGDVIESIEIIRRR